jgi:hypothetical protein
MSEVTGKDNVHEREDRLATRSTYSLLLLDALATSGALSNSWKRPRRHNRAIERKALYFALRLDQNCRSALTNGRAMPSAGVAGVEARYEIQAAIQTVHVVLPFTLAERDVLTPPEMLPRPPEEREPPLNPQFEDETAVPDRRLLERWHKWLWMDEHGVPQPNVGALGASAILGEGCNRLCTSLPEVMEGIGREL